MKQIFSKLDNLVHDKLRAWAKYRGKGNINNQKDWRTAGDQNMYWGARKRSPDASLFPTALEAKSRILKEFSALARSSAETVYDSRFEYSKRKNSP